MLHVAKSAATPPKLDCYICLLSAKEEKAKIVLDGYDKYIYDSIS
jgi:hypothetical protein